MNSRNKFLIAATAGALVVGTYLGCPSRTASNGSQLEKYEMQSKAKNVSYEPSMAEDTPVLSEDKPEVLGNSLQRIVEFYLGQNSNVESPISESDSSVRYTKDGMFVTPDMDVPDSETYATESEAREASFSGYLAKRGEESIENNEYEPGSALEALDDAYDLRGKVKTGAELLEIASGLANDLSDIVNEEK